MTFASLVLTFMCNYGEVTMPRHMLQILQKGAADPVFCRVMGRPIPKSGLNMFQHDEQVWVKGGQQLLEFWSSGEAHLKASRAR